MLTFEGFRWLWEIRVSTGRGLSVEKPASKFHRCVMYTSMAAGAATFVASFGAFLLPALMGWGLVESGVLFCAGLACSRQLFELPRTMSKAIAAIHHITMGIRGVEWAGWRDSQVDAARLCRQMDDAAIGYDGDEEGEA